MTGWDIRPSGVQSILSLVGDAADGLEKDVKAYGTNMESAATSAGTISGLYCGEAPVGPVAVALANFAKDTENMIKFMAARTGKTMEGTVKATTEYVEGDVEMAAEAQRKALAAPDLSELPGGGKQDSK
ncbi:hypothetical protein H9Y04_36185 [Streptomyces sp. TRM66268-LWL]|uniref:ESX-1 secretion-associated protein n=1 Tax=Streptomyces polyasparticus TaxID=2767826 RepID=A0ABR7STW8_9ACTN|nr:DUF6507 family protein [Streptomyces polyasparticus]MBC9717986.1 hypothetical protein [Streptomyces polyasparticus]